MGPCASPNWPTCGAIEAGFRRELAPVVLHIRRRVCVNCDGPRRFIQGCSVGAPLRSRLRPVNGESAGTSGRQPWKRAFQLCTALAADPWGPENSGSAAPERAQAPPSIMQLPSPPRPARPQPGAVELHPARARDSKPPPQSHRHHHHNHLPSFRPPHPRATRHHLQCQCRPRRSACHGTAAFDVKGDGRVL